MKNDNKRIFKEEEDKITELRKFINKEIENNSNKLKLYENDITKCNKIDESNRQMLIKENKKLSKIYKNPYYARMDIKYNEDNKRTIIYIGNKDYNKFGEENEYIISWAAPIASVFNKFNVGEFKQVNEKLTFSGVLSLKRRIDIEKENLVRVLELGYINDEKEEEDRLIDKIEASDTKKLGSIITTIQKDQDEIIRQPIGKCILVQGCAGSGKSSVAYHRLAQLIYNNKLKKEEVLVIAPNKIFIDYTKELVGELGVDYEITQLTFIEFAKKILGRDFEIFNNKVVKDDREKNLLITSDKYKKLIDNFIKYIDENMIPKENINLEEFEFISYKKMNDLWQNKFKGYKLNNKIEKFRQYISEMLKKNIEKYIGSIEEEYANKSYEFKKNLINKTQIDQVTKLYIEELEVKRKRIRASLSYLLRNYMLNFIQLDVRQLYNKLISDKEMLIKINENIFNDNDLDIIISENSNGKLTYINAIIAAYIYCNINEVKMKYRHIVIDECQDLSPIEISIIENLTQSFTLTGDFNQRINLCKTTTSYEYIVDLFKKYTYFNTYYLNKSFRNTKEITLLANSIMKSQFINSSFIPESFNRDGEKCELKIFKNNEEKYKEIIDIINNEQNKKNRNKTVGIIFKDKKLCEEFYKIIKNYNWKMVKLINKEDDLLIDGINIIDVKISKGLEFDYVIVADLEKYRSDLPEDIRLLYIAITRALKKVTLLSCDNENNILNNVDKDSILVYDLNCNSKDNNKVLVHEILDTCNEEHELKIFKNDKERYKGIINIIENKRNNNKIIGIILKDKRKCTLLYESIIKCNLGMIKLIRRESDTIINGINIIEAKLAKTLKFDCIIIADLENYNDDSKYDIKLLHNITKIALERPVILSINSENTILSKTNKGRIPQNSSEINQIDIAFRNMIKDVINNIFGNIPKRIQENIDSIHDPIKLSLLLDKINNECYSINDIDKLVDKIVNS